MNSSQQLGDQSKLASSPQLPFHNLRPTDGHGAGQSAAGRHHHHHGSGHGHHGSPSRHEHGLHLKYRTSMGHKHSVQYAQSQAKPHHVQYTESLLYQHGISYYEKAVTGQLLEFMNYYTSEIINESQVNRKYRDKDCESKLTNKDVKLAIKFKQMNSFQRPMESQSIQRIASEKNSIPLTKLVLEKYASTGQGHGRADDPSSIISDPKLIQERSAMVNMNGMPQKVLTQFRVDYPNIQIMSEEIMNQIKDRQRDVYGIPVKSNVIDLDSSSLDEGQPSGQQQQEHKPPTVLGKRKIDFDEQGIAQDAAANQASVEQFKQEQEQKVQEHEQKVQDFSKTSANNTTVNTTSDLMELQKRQKMKHDPSINVSMVDDDQNIDFDDMGDDDNKQNDTNPPGDTGADGQAIGHQIGMTHQLSSSAPVAASDHMIEDQPKLPDEHIKSESKQENQNVLNAPPSDDEDSSSQDELFA